MPGAPDMVIHAAITLPDGGLLMASDDLTGDGGGTKGIAVSYTAKDPAEAERVFAALSEGGEVTAPLTETFFSPRLGMCVDKWGVAWMVNTEAGSARRRAGVGLTRSRPPARSRPHCQSALAASRRVRPVVPCGGGGSRSTPAKNTRFTDTS